MGPFEMVVAIIAIITIGKIIQSKHKAKHGIIEDEDMLGNKTQRLLNNSDQTSSPLSLVSLLCTTAIFAPCGGIRVSFIPSDCGKCRG